MAYLFVQCVICCSDVEAENSSAQLNAGCENNKFVESSVTPPAQPVNLLEAQLNVIFILRNIFEVDQEQLELYLRKYGDPGRWLKLCGRCEEDVSDLRKIFGRLHEIKRELERRKRVIQDKVRISENEEEKTATLTLEGTTSGREFIPYECRRSYILRYKMKPPTFNENTFECGDGKAKALALKIEELPKQDLVEGEIWNDEDSDLVEDEHYENRSRSVEEEIFHDENSMGSSSSSNQSNEAQCKGWIVSDGAEFALKDADEDPLNGIPQPEDTQGGGTHGVVDPDNFVAENVKSQISRKRRICSDNPSLTESPLPHVPTASKRICRPRLIRQHQVAFCPICDTRFFMGTLLPFSKHLPKCIASSQSQAATNTPLKCSMCKTFCTPRENVQQFLEHVVMCREINPSGLIPWRHFLLKCNLCQDSSSIPYSELALHIYKYHQHQFGCTRCPFRHWSSAFLTTTHWTKDHSDLTYVTVECRFEKLADGMKVLLPGVPWWCPASNCLKEFPDESSRDLHLVTCQHFESQLPERSTHCLFCSQSHFFEEESLMHRVIVHGYFAETRPKRNSKRKQQVTQLTCQICQKTFRWKSEYQQHMRVAHYWRCEVCDMDCKVEKVLTRHMVSEHNRLPGRNYSCPKEGCVSIMRSYGGLKEHLSRNHSTMYACSFCGKKFGTQDALRKHTKQCRLPTFKCSFFKLKFATQEMLSRHRTESHQKRYKKRKYPEKKALTPCDVCGKVFVSLDKANRHKKRIHERKYNKSCPECGVVFGMSNDLKIHLITEHGIGEGHTCSACGKIFVTELGLKKHKEKEGHGDDLNDSAESSSGGQLKCSWEGCGKYFKSFDLLKYHENGVHKRMFEQTCEVCGLMLSTKACLKSHMATIHGAKEEDNSDNAEEKILLKCGYEGCGKEFKGQGNLQQHQRHVHERRYEKPCPHCGKVLASSQSLKVHMESAHAGEAEAHSTTSSGPSVLLQCSWDGCGKEFKTQHNLNIHRNRVHERRYERACPKCGKVLANRKSYKLHMERVHGEKATGGRRRSERKSKANVQSRKRPISKPETPLVCDRCGKSFERRLYLNSHVKLFHEKDFPEKCDVCGKGLRGKRFLYLHKANVHGIGDFKCEVVGCSKIFWKKELFEDHVKVKHEGKHKYSCQFCGKGFALHGQMKHHEEAMHTNRESKPFKCPVSGCEGAFATNNYLIYHLKHTHKTGKRKLGIAMVGRE